MPSGEKLETLSDMETAHQDVYALTDERAAILKSGKDGYDHEIYPLHNELSRLGPTQSSRQRREETVLERTMY
jgi:hypothetical protein